MIIDDIIDRLSRSSAVWIFNEPNQPILVHGPDIIGSDITIGEYKISRSEKIELIDNISFKVEINNDIITFYPLFHAELI